MNEQVNPVLTIPDSSTPGAGESPTSTPAPFKSPKSDLQKTAIDSGGEVVLKFIKEYFALISTTAAFVAVTLLYYFHDLSVLRADISQNTQKIAVLQVQLDEIKGKVSVLDAHGDKIEAIQTRIAVLQEKVAQLEKNRDAK